jgi:hypothetical protein
LTKTDSSRILVPVEKTITPKQPKEEPVKTLCISLLALAMCATVAHADETKATKRAEPERSWWMFHLVDGKLYGNPDQIDEPLCAAPVEYIKREGDNPYSQGRRHVLDEQATLAKLTKRGYTWSFEVKDGQTVFITRREGKEPCNIAALRTLAEYHSGEIKDFTTTVHVMMPPGFQMTAADKRLLTSNAGHGTGEGTIGLGNLGTIGKPIGEAYGVGGLGLVPSGSAKDDEIISTPPPPTGSILGPLNPPKQDPNMCPPPDAPAPKKAKKQK